MSKKQNSSNNIAWTPVVAFYFRVSFQRGVQCNVSFSEVSGLDIKMEFDEKGHYKNTKRPDLVLQRAMHAIPDDLSKWVRKFTNFDGFITTCDLTISLLNEKGDVVAAWFGTNAYPKKLTISPFKSDASELVIEKLTLTCETIERTK